VLAGAVALQWTGSRELHVGSDDRTMMAASRDLAAGRWDRLLAPQGDHLLPLLRLVRLGFDLRFPDGFYWLHALTLAAHCGSTALLFRLSLPHLGAVGATAAAACFAWNALGAGALVHQVAEPVCLDRAVRFGGLGRPAAGASLGVRRTAPGRHRF
jgi:hypothetical protein